MSLFKGLLGSQKNTSIPKIVIKGDNPLHLKIGESIPDDVIIENYPEDKPVMNGVFSNEKVGTYTVTYKYNCKNGCVAEANRTVIVYNTLKDRFSKMIADMISKCAIDKSKWYDRYKYSEHLEIEHLNGFKDIPTFLSREMYHKVKGNTIDVNESFEKYTKRDN